MIFRTSTVSVPRELFFARISAILQALYVKSRKQWRDAHPEKRT